MDTFNEFRDAINTQLQIMSKHQLLRADVDRDVIIETYLNSFDEGDNPIFRERTEHDCSCCKQFIRNAGTIVTFIQGKRVSIWDTVTEGKYGPVAKALSELVLNAPIKDKYLHFEKNVGTKQNHEQTDSGVITWDHFYAELPDNVVRVNSKIPTELGEARSNKEVFERSVTEITDDSITTVLDLIGQGSLYRGEEHKSLVTLLRKCKKEYDKADDKEMYLWAKSLEIGRGAAIRNTVIGTLLIDLSDDVPLEHAVDSFGKKMDPTNYKRPKTLYTAKMVASAEKDITSLGYMNSLPRRHASIDDITINNILFVSREAKKAMNVFDEMASEVPVSKKSFDKVEEVSIDTFINDILPTASSLEVMFENKNVSNLMSLTTSVDKDAPSMFTWDNNFAWSYNGDVTDSIKERVKKAGGSVTGDLRCSLSWFNFDDLDIHLHEPDGYHIYYSHNRNPSTGGNLDVDMNAGGGKSRTPVENITYPNKSKMKEGVYTLKVHNYSKRETKDVGFDVEIEFGGEIHTFHYSQAVGQSKYITVATFEYSHNNGLKIIKSIPSTMASKTEWDIATQNFHKVVSVMNSPNHWDGNSTGNRHTFFILEGCKNPDDVRGLYNEYLKSDLQKHRKVFEMLGNKMKSPYTDSQLSGLGFSSTKKDTLIVKVSGSFNRTVKVKF